MKPEYWQFDMTEGMQQLIIDLKSAALPVIEPNRSGVYRITKVK